MLTPPRPAVFHEPAPIVLRRDEPHPFVHGRERRRRRGARLLGADREQSAQLALVGPQLGVALLHGREQLDDRLADVGLQVAVGALQLGDRPAGRHRQDLDQVRHAGLLLGPVEHLAAGVGDGRPELPADRVGRVEDEHGALQRPAGRRHLPRRVLEVHDPRADVGEDALRDRERMTVAGVEALRDVARELDVLALVVADGHDVGLVEEDVARHQHGVGEEAGRDELLALALILELSHPAELAEAGDRRQQPRRLRVRGHLALQEQRAAVGVEADRVQQRGEVERAVVEVAGVVLDRDRVQVDDAEEGVARLLRRDVLAHRADVVADVLGARRLDAGEDARHAPQDTERRSLHWVAMTVTRETWSPSSWRELPVRQQPDWPDAAAVAAAVERLKACPPLVFAGEARQLQEGLAAVLEGRAFLLQAGDCVESFTELSSVRIRDKLKILLQMSAVLTYGATLPVLKVGRIAGQFTKPRSQPFEHTANGDVPVFRGHMVHDDAATAEARVPDPQRMVEGYNQSAATLNLLRAFTKGGYADLNQVHLWNQEFVASSPEGRRYERLANEIERALRFMAACGIDLAAERRLHEVDVFTSHEGLLLDYEEGLTRRDSLTGDWYDCSAHLLWIGERTRQVDGAHVEFFSGVHNPLAVKLGPEASADDAIALCERLNPGRVPGRLTFVARLGAERVRELLPPLLGAVREEGHPVVWACDPMHGNGIVTAGGIKTRRL